MVILRKKENVPLARSLRRWQALAIQRFNTPPMRLVRLGVGYPQTSAYLQAEARGLTLEGVSWIPSDPTAEAIAQAAASEAKNAPKGVDRETLQRELKPTKRERAFNVSDVGPNFAGPWEGTLPRRPEFFGAQRQETGADTLAAWGVARWIDRQRLSQLGAFERSCPDWLLDKGLPSDVVEGLVHRARRRLAPWEYGPGRIALARRRGVWALHLAGGLAPRLEPTVIQFRMEDESSFSPDRWENEAAGFVAAQERNEALIAAYGEEGAAERRARLSESLDLLRGLWRAADARDRGEAVPLVSGYTFVNQIAKVWFREYKDFMAKAVKFQNFRWVFLTKAQATVLFQACALTAKRLGASEAQTRMVADWRPIK